MNIGVGEGFKICVSRKGPSLQVKFSIDLTDSSPGDDNACATWLAMDKEFILTVHQVRKFMSCSHVKSCVNLLTWLLIGYSLLCSQSGASFLVDTTLDNDYNSFSIP